MSHPGALIVNDSFLERIRCNVCAFLCQNFDVQSLLDDVRKLKIIAKGHERRIKYLEEKLASYEEDDDKDDEDGHN